MNVTPAGTDSTVGPVPDGTIVAAHRRRATRSRRVVPAAVAIVAIVSGLILPTALPPAGAEPPAASSAAGSSLDPALVAQLDAALDKGFANSGMPGVTVGLWIPGQGEWVATRGVSNIETNEPMDRANQGKIGSITKTLVGTTALQIIGEGQVGLTLDNTIDRWYPGFPEAANITVRMLMNMSSGIASPGHSQLDRICADPYSTITPDEYIAIGAATPRAPFAPGDGFMYSGFNTFLLARILEKATGVDLTTLLDERLLAPLAMSRSRFAPDGQLTAPLPHGYTNFCPQDPPLTDTTDWYNHESWAAGTMLSTIDDLHTWGLALGTGFGLTPERLAARVDDMAPGDSGYGLGVGVRRDPATGCVLDLSHAGAEPGYGAYVANFTTTGSMLALMGNGDGGTGEASFAVLKALVPVLFPVVDDPPKASCRATPTSVVTAAPAAPVIPVIPVTVEPAFAG
jgi:D-alanyl-D-alanine carboxypeptidase